MSNVPCIEKFKAMVAAIGKLSVAKCAMTGAATGAIQWGRTMSGNGTPDLVYAADSAVLTPFHAASYSCAAGTACYGGLWLASNPTRQGMSRDRICNYWDSIYPSASYALLKNTPRPEDCVEASWSVSAEPCGSPTGSGFNSFDIRLREVPVENEYLLEIINPASITQNHIGNFIDAIVPAASHAISEADSFEIYTYFHVYSGTGFPDILPYLPEGATILGAIGQIRLNSLTAYHDHVDFDGETTEGVGGCYTWSSTSDAYTETLTDPVQIKIAALGQKNDGTIVVLQDDTISPGGRGLTDEWIWVDMGSAVKALFENLNGPYKSGGMHLFAYAGETLDDLLAAQYDDDYLLKMRAKPDVLSCTSRANGTIETMAYSLDTYRLLYSSMDVQNLHVAFSLPSSAVSNLIGYFTWPALD